MNIKERMDEILKHVETVSDLGIGVTEMEAVESSVHAELVKVEAGLLNLVAKLKTKLAGKDAN